MERLDATLRVLTGYRLRRTTSLAMSRLNTLFAQYGLRRTTFATLAIVVAHPGLRQGKVAEALEIDRPNFVKIVVELESAGLISRETVANDKRAYALIATPKGEKVYRDAASEAHVYEASLTRGLSPSQIEALHAALDVISKNSTRQETADGH